MSGLATVIGDGQMALVTADALAVRGVGVRMWSPFPAEASTLARTRRSGRLPGFELPAAVDVTSDIGAVFNGVNALISAIPTQFLREVWQRLGPQMSGEVSIISVTKGIEIGTSMRPTQVIEDVLDRTRTPTRGFSLTALSGPAIAAELARRLPASLVAASKSDTAAQFAQDLLRVPWLRVYRHSDVIGVEIAGATKNIVALAAGMIDGLEAGTNAKSALLARGLAEVARLGVAMGAKLDTFFGIAGVGDLATTCFSPEGRNRTCGERLARGESLDSILSSMTSVVEGVPTTRAVMQMARAHNVEMPITAAVHAILFEGLSPRDAIRELMSRELKAEQVG
jgi:glycerol-3-phosphate dehydrogenase (NAD(P)+)